MALFDQLGPGDMAKVGTFGNDVTISPEFTNNRRALAAALPTVIHQEATALWKGVNQAMDSFGTADERKVILVLSDGKDAPMYRFREKFVGQLEVVDRAVREDVMIYGIGMRSRGPASPMGIGVGNIKAAMVADLPDPGLGTAAVETGGGYIEIRPQMDVTAAFTRVAEELHSQYMIGFAPPALDGKTHKIEAPRVRRQRTRKSRPQELRRATRQVRRGYGVFEKRVVRCRPRAARSRTLRVHQTSGALRQTRPATNYTLLENARRPRPTLRSVLNLPDVAAKRAVVDRRVVVSQRPVNSRSGWSSVSSGPPAT